MSSWPLISDFSRMLQTPKVAFRAPALRELVIEKDYLGQPRARSGNFATVFKGIRPDGSEIAIRVFNRAADERRERYAALGRYLEDRAVSSLVRFDYDEKGIRSASDGQLYPLLTMDWVPGVTLFEWCRDRCHEGYGEALAIAAEVWLQLVRELEAHQIVHGDLQHANVLVSSDGHFKLVDYDCMAVPELMHRRNLEVGMIPYQHPGRDENTLLFPGLDHFSALVIYVALRGLAAAPHLWITYVDQLGYDRLLFRREDFENPNQSHLYYELMHSPDEQVRDLTHYLFQLRRYQLHQIPPIDEVLLWCNSLEQLLAAQDWDTAVQLVKRMAPSEQIDPHLKPLVDQAHARVSARQALEQALALGDELEVQRRYIPDLLDDYPAAAPLVEQARQAGRVRQILEVLRAARRFQKWDFFRRTWEENKDLLDKRPSAREFKPEYKKIVAAETLQRLLQDSNSDDQAVIDCWNYLQARGGHPLADDWGPTVQARIERQRHFQRLRELIRNQPDPPTLEHDKQIYLAWKREFFDGWERISLVKRDYRAVVKRLQRIQRLREYAKTVSYEGEMALAEAFNELPPGYDRSLKPRIELAQRRMRAFGKFMTLLQKAKTDDEILEALKRTADLQIERMLTGPQRARVLAVKGRADLLAAIRQIEPTWSAQQTDAKLLEVWDEEALAGCKEADAWRPRYEEARERRALIEAIRRAVTEEDQAAIVRLVRHPLLEGYPLPADLDEKVRDLREQATQEWLQRRQALIGVLRSGNRAAFVREFDPELVREVCEKFVHHRPVVTQWVEAELTPLSVCGLALPAPRTTEEGAADVPALQKLDDHQFRACWQWPDARIAAVCRIVVSPVLPKPGANLDDLPIVYAVRLDRANWDAAGGFHAFSADPAWEGMYVLVWGEIDLGFQQFTTEPLLLGQLHLAEEKKRGWSLRGLFRDRKKEDRPKEEIADQPPADGSGDSPPADAASAAEPAPQPAPSAPPAGSTPPRKPRKSPELPRPADS